MPLLLTPLLLFSSHPLLFLALLSPLAVPVLCCVYHPPLTHFLPSFPTHSLPMSPPSAIFLLPVSSSLLVVRALPPPLSIHARVRHWLSQTDVKDRIPAHIQHLSDSHRYLLSFSVPLHSFLPPSARFYLLFLAAIDLSLSRSQTTV